MSCAVFQVQDDLSELRSHRLRPKEMLERLDVKHIVLTDRLRAPTIRPPEGLARLRRGVEDDARRLLLDAELETVPCPGCGSSDSGEAFRSNGFTFRDCRECGSLYVSPRPTPDALFQFYRDSEAGRLRVEYFTEATAVARMQHIVASRVDWVAQVLDRHAGDGSNFADIGTMYPLLFNEMRRLGRFEQLFAMDPPPTVGEQLHAEDTVVGWPQVASVSALTAFEQFEHQSVPLVFLTQLRDLLAERGVLFLTARTVSGFDLQVLWDRTPYIFVPDHLNLLSVEGIERLLSRAGLEALEISTPGQLDVELVMDATRADSSIEVPRFLRYMLAKRSDDTLADLQAFLQKHRLSSHVRVAARRDGGGG